MKKYFVELEVVNFKSGYVFAANEEEAEEAFDELDDNELVRSKSWANVDITEIAEGS